HRAGARIFSSTGPGSPMKLIRELDNPDGRLPDRELVTDRPGQTSESARPGRRALAPEKTPSAHVADQFVQEIVAVLEAGRKSGAYERLVLVAAPEFLGRLRGALPETTAAKVAASLDKNIPDADPEGIRRRLADTILI
ncbi:MAG: host attachment protein, partial [Candidatus Methylomirabilis sp.]|nr:host attachment protein [Deltaproteobacteria bacterium]